MSAIISEVLTPLVPRNDTIGLNIQCVCLQIAQKKY